MSANPEAFDFLRHNAYRFVQKHGKNARHLHEHCTELLTAWRQGEGAGSGLTDTEADQIIGDVARWTISNYRPPRPKANRHREERAAAELSAPALLEFAAESFGSPTIRNAARVGGQSKSTVARHLRQQGIAPKRQKKIDALPARVRWLVQVLDETFQRDGAALLKLDDLAAAVWDKVTIPRLQTARSTIATRRKKLAEYLWVVDTAGIGFHLVAVGDVVAVSRGRRFPRPKEVAIWVEDERRLRGISCVILPPELPAVAHFWNDPWLQDVLALFSIGQSPWFTSPTELEPLLRLTRPLLDARPLYHLFGLAISRGYYFTEDLSALGSRVVDPTIRSGVFKIARDIDILAMRRDFDPHPIDAFDEANHYLKFMLLIREVAPVSYARIRYFREVILEDICRDDDTALDRVPAMLVRCRELRELEQRGKWKPPTSEQIARFHPDNEQAAIPTSNVTTVRKNRTKGRLGSYLSEK
jgi:hypothetical protein